MKTLSLVAISCLFILFCVSASSSNQNLFDPPLWFAKFHENAYLPGVVQVCSISFNTNFSTLSQHTSVISVNVMLQIVHATSGFLLKYSKAFVLPRVHMFQLNNATGIKLTREVSGPYFKPPIYMLVILAFIILRQNYHFSFLRNCARFITLEGVGDYTKRGSVLL